MNSLKQLFWWILSLFVEKYVLKIKTARREIIEKELDEIQRERRRIQDECSELLLKRKTEKNIKARQIIDDRYNGYIEQLRVLTKREDTLNSRLRTCISIN